VVRPIADGRRVVRQASAVRLAEAVGRLGAAVVETGIPMPASRVAFALMERFRGAMTVSLADGWFTRNRRLGEGLVWGRVTIRVVSGTVRVLLRGLARLGAVRSRWRTALTEEDIDWAGGPR
jgi:hypothetical protein